MENYDQSSKITTQNIPIIQQMFKKTTGKQNA